MTQESPSKFFPTVSGISGRVPRRTHTIRHGVLRVPRKEAVEKGSPAVSLLTLLVNRLRDDENEPDAFTDEEGRAFITEATNAVLSEAITAMQQAIVTQLEARLSHLDERLTMQDARQADVLARFKAEQTSAITETSETMTAMVETTLRKRDVRETVSPVPSSKVRSISDAPSRKGAERDIDKIIWPLLNSGLTVRAIAERAETSTATVGRSRKRWEAQKDVSVDQPETDRTEMLVTNS